MNIPEEKYFNPTDETLQDIMEKLDLSEDEEREDNMVELTDLEQNQRNFGYKRGLSDILKTKLMWLQGFGG